MGNLVDFIRPTQLDRARFGARAPLYCVCRLANVVLFATAFAVAVTEGIAPDVDASPTFGHWRSGQRSLTVVDRTGDPRWQEATRWAVERWNEAGSSLRIVWTTGSGPCDYSGTTVSVCQVPSEQLGSLGPFHLQGVAEQERRGDHVAGAFIRVCSDCRMSVSRRRQVTTHELGHVLGLLHSRRPGSVMYSSGGREAPDAADYEDLRAITDHRD